MEGRHADVLARRHDREGRRQVVARAAARLRVLAGDLEHYAGALGHDPQWHAEMQRAVVVEIEHEARLVRAFVDCDAG